MSLAIVIHTCDKSPYRDIWDEFFGYFCDSSLYKEQKWPIYFCNEEFPYEIGGIKQIRTGAGSWTSRLKTALHRIPEKNILYIQEDFLIQAVNTEDIKYALSLHRYFQLDITKLGSNYEFEGMTFAHSGPHALSIQVNGSYLMSHQPCAIFNKSFLLSTLCNVEWDASTHELETTRRILNGDFGHVKILCLGNQYNPNRSDILTFHHAIRKGTYIPYE